MGNCLSRILKAHSSRQDSGDSSAEADINIGGDGSGNPNSQSFTNQINEPGNSLSSSHEAHSSLQGPGDSAVEANTNTRDHGSGNSDSHKSTNQVDKTGNIISNTHRAHSALQGDSNAEANVGVRSDCNRNSESPKSTNQIDDMGNSLSSSHRAHSSPPSTKADIYSRGDFSGNTGSRNQFYSNNTNHYYGTGSSDNEAKILRCLYKSSYESHRNRVRKPAEGTCAWVTEHKKYKDWWEQRKPGLLWLSADPGCGKSVTASFLIRHLETQTDAIVCYFFFKDDSDEQRSPTLALCALLHQLFSQRNTLCRYAEQAFKAKGKGFTEDVDTLWDILVKAVAEGGCGDVICVMDALDECEETTLTPLIRYMASLPGSQNSKIPLKFLVTSRPYHRIEIELGLGAAIIRLKGENEIKAITNDVARVIDEGIKSLELVWGNRGGLEYLRELLRSSADRTFLWVSLILEILRNSVEGSRAELITIVSTAPASLDELYTKILAKSTDDVKARKVLNIVVAAARPLTLIEMNIALAVRRDHESMKDLQSDLYPRFKKTVKNLCGLFVRVIDSKIYLVHQTAREFLIKGSSPGQGNWQYTLDPKDSNFVMADICLSYISLKEFENDPLPTDTDFKLRNRACNDYTERYAFLDYAASHWADHFRYSQDHRMVLFELTRQVCEAGSQRFLTWLQVYWSKTTGWYLRPDDWTHLMIASWLGQGTVVDRLLDEGGDINARSELYGTALNIAAIRRDGDITRKLLYGGAKAYLNGREFNILHMKQIELEEIEQELFERRFARLFEEAEEFARAIFQERVYQDSLGSTTILCRQIADTLLLASFRLLCLYLVRISPLLLASPTNSQRASQSYWQHRRIFASPMNRNRRALLPCLPASVW